jgi:tetratricopeptide (TPR) repeat protein
LEEIAYMNYQNGKFLDAAKQFQKLTNQEPKNINWLFTYAECLMRSNDSQGAIKALDKLEEQTGSNPELTIEKFRLYRQIKQDEKGIAELQKTLKTFPKDVQLLANLVDYYFEKNQAEKAFDYLFLLSEADPSNGNAQLALAQYYDQKGDKVSSYSALKKAFASDDIKLDQKMKILLSMYDAQVKLDPEVIEISTVLMNKYPEDAKVYAVRGDLFLKNEQADLALDAFQKALKFDESKYAIWDQVLIMEYQKQDFQALYTHSKRCLELFPTLVNVYLLHAISATQTGKFNEAIESLDLGKELITNDKPMLAEFLAQKGEALFNLKNYTEGKANYEESLKIKPDQILTLNNYAYHLALAKLDLNQAENMILKVLEKFPEDSRYLDTYGWILFQQGKYNDAAKIFKKAFQVKSDDKLINEHLGDVAFKLNQFSEAVDFWINAKKLGATNKMLDKKIEKKTYYEPVY